MQNFNETLAMYLPQFHQTGENDAWWGKGFTEWTLTQRCKPLFNGHTQPKLPEDGIFYDLSDGAHIASQYQLARKHGISGFNSYFYWSKGNRLLSEPIDAAFNNPDLDFRLCFTWANHPWTRTWSNRKGASEILFAQNYEETSDEFDQFAKALCQYFQDTRYIKLSGRPIFCIYKPEDLPPSFVMNLTTAFSRLGVNPYLVGFINRASVRGRFEGLDAVTLFNPTNSLFEKGDQLAPRRLSRSSLRKWGLTFGGHFYDKFTEFKQLIFGARPRLTSFDFISDRVVSNYKSTKSDHSLPVFPMANVGFDNTPRYGNRARIFINFSPDLLKTQILSLNELLQARSYEHSLFFINAWNEWGEGMHLEPDTEFGRSKLKAVKAALFESNSE